MSREGDLEEFAKAVEEAFSKILEHAKKGSYVRVTSHLDSDGLAAAGIVGCLLHSLDALFCIRIERQLDEEVLNSASEEDADLYIFTDCGSGYLDLILEHLGSRDVVVLDHHQPVEASGEKLWHVNPHLFGFDGARDVSASGVAYFVARNASPEDYAYLAPIAIVGAVGDMQDRNPERELRGLNKQIVEDGIRYGYVDVEKDLLLFGRETRPVHVALASTTSPFMPGLSGEEDSCYAFLRSIGIDAYSGDRPRTLSDLSWDEKQKLFTGVVKYLVSKGVSSDSILSLIGCAYTFLNEEKGSPLRDAREFSALINSCGKMGKAGLGVAVCMGDRGSALKEAMETYSEYRRRIAKFLNWVVTDPGARVRMQSIDVVRGEDVIDDRMLSTVATIISTSGLMDDMRPLIALAKDEHGRIKVSARTSPKAVSKGLNLGEIMSKAASLVGGRGGGHDIAAGANIPEGGVDEFLRAVDSMVKSALGSS